MYWIYLGFCKYRIYSGFLHVLGFWMYRIYPGFLHVLDLQGFASTGSTQGSCMYWINLGFCKYRVLACTGSIPLGFCMYLGFLLYWIYPVFLHVLEVLQVQDLPRVLACTGSTQCSCMYWIYLGFCKYRIYPGFLHVLDLYLWVFACTGVLECTGST